MNWYTTLEKLNRMMQPSINQLGFKLTAFIQLPRIGFSPVLFSTERLLSFAAARSGRGSLLSLRVTPAMASKKPLSTNPILHQDKKDKMLKGFPKTSPNPDKPDDIQCIKDNPEKIEEMTVQQLKTTLRSLGVPAKGRKYHLVAALKSFMNKHLDGESAQETEEMIYLKNPAQILPLKRAENISAETCAQTMNTVSEVSHLKKRMKKSLADDETGEGDIETVRIGKKLSSRTYEVSVGNSSRTRKKVHSVIDSDAGVTSLATLPQAEPWTVLAHKKPQKGWIPYNPKTMRPEPPQDTESVRLMSWNVNGLRALLKLEGFSALELAQRENFDVLCLQETKLKEEDVESIKQSLIDGYESSFWTCSHSKLGYSGTAIVSRIKPLSVKYGLGISDHDTEGRIVTAEFDSFYLINGYVPNSGDGLKRLSYRITQWDPSLSNYMKELEKKKPVILTGDLNCAHQEIDIYNPAGNKRSAGFTIEERQSFEENFLSRGFVDTFRRQHPNAVGYTYWGYRHGGRKTNKGWRLDYFLVSESIADNVHDSYIVPDVAGSDHCPIGLVLKL